ncbi:MAG: hypothetical protein ACJ74O_04520 [Frankiaceae bacterium]
MTATAPAGAPVNVRAVPAVPAPVRRNRGDLAVTATVIAWVGGVLLLDRGAGITGQRLLGLGTWLVLAGLLARETGRVRAQVGVVVAFASLIEYTFSGALHVYVYRLHNVPLFVPPGHGLVYLGALAFGRSRFARERARALVAATLVAGGGYALWGLTLAPRLDALGAFWFGCLALFCLRGRVPTVFVGAFVIVTYLELLGTSLGSWTWQPHDFTGIVAIGNPPSGAAGGYGFFDAAALAAAPWLTDRFSRRLSRWRTPRVAAPGRR